VGYDQQGWKDLFGSMVLLSPGQANTIAAYLGTPLS